jgi:galactose-1-phosphate uridylyltransferase
VLRLSFMAGFEMGSGMHINPSLPEACAEFLRDVDLAQFAEEKMQPR